MLHKLRLMFKKDSGNITKASPELNMCLVDIQLEGKNHIFYQEASFIDCVTNAVKNAPGFIEYRTRKGGYIINSACIDFIRIRDDVHKIPNDDASGYSVYLAGIKDSIDLGKLELTLEHITGMLASKSEQFIRLGSYYFNRDDIALIVSNNN